MGETADEKRAEVVNRVARLIHGGPGLIDATGATEQAEAVLALLESGQAGVWLVPKEGIQGTVGVVLQQLRDARAALASAEADVEDFRQRLGTVLGQRDEARGQVAGLRAELAEFTGSYGEWHIVTGYRADGSKGPTLAGTGVLPEKLDRVRVIREERPELVSWRVDRCERWTRRVPGVDPVAALVEYEPGMSQDAAELLCAELGIVAGEVPS